MIYEINVVAQLNQKFLLQKFLGKFFFLPSHKKDFLRKTKIKICINLLEILYLTLMKRLMLQQKSRLFLSV